MKPLTPLEMLEASYSEKPSVKKRRERIATQVLEALATCSFAGQIDSLADDLAYMDGKIAKKASAVACGWADALIAELDKSK